MQQFDCPQPAAGAAAWPLLLTANVESCFSSFAVWHLGHAGCCLPKRMASNLCPHSSQRYSKIGILAPGFRGSAVSRCCISHSRLNNGTTIIDAAWQHQLPKRSRSAELG